MRKKNILGLSLCLIAASALWAFASAPPKQEVYRVKNATEFILALGDNRIIILETGPAYNISEGFRDDMVWAFINGEDKISVGVDYDGPSLVLNQIENLTIRSEGSRPLRLLSEATHSFVLTFEQCKNISIINLEIGHAPEQGACDGGVLEFIKCQDILVQQCRLFGCGTEGIRSNECRNLRCEDSDIYDCSDYIFTIHRSSKIFFSGCHFYDVNAYRDLIVVDAATREVVLENCVMYNNSGVLFDVRSSLTLKNCHIIHPEAMLGTMYAVQQEKCTWDEPKINYNYEN